MHGIKQKEISLLTNKSLFEGQSPSRPDKHKIVPKFEKIPEKKNDFENIPDTNNLLVVTLCS